MFERGTFITALSLLLLLASVGCHASEVSEDDDWSSPPPRSEVLTFLNTPVELLHAIYTNHTPKPTFVLYTDKHLYNNHLMEARRGVEQMAALLPPNYADFYEMQMDETDLADRSWYAIVSMGIPRLPSLALYGCSLQRSFHFPGNFLNSFPAFFPHYFNGELTNVTGMVNWALSVAPTQYVDPVTLHQVDAVSIVSSHDDVRSWILNTAEGLDNKLSPSISVYPQRVLMAYVNLSSTLSGSEVVIASLFNRAAQKGNALLTAITDNAEVAAVWGIRKMNHAAHAPFSSVLEQWRSAGKKKHITAIASVRDLVVVKDELTPQNVASTVDDIVASTTTQDFRAVQKATTARVQRNVDLFRKHPMRKIASSHHLQRVMLTLQQSVKVVFFLRQSDEDFAKQFAVAEDFAKRIQSTAVNFKMNDYSIQEHMWAPPMRTEAFWIDADQQPVFTSHMELRSVPAVILLMPLPNAKEKEQIDNGVLYLNISHGAHIITRQDLNTPQEEPSSGLHDLKAFQPGFPRDSSELIRLFASPMLPKRLQYGMFPVHHYELVLEPEDEDNVNEELCLASKSSAAFCFLEVDLRHYPREVSPPPRLVRDLFDGDAMPDTDEEERDNGVKAKTSTPYSRRALEKKQEKEAQRLKWQEEMEEKRRRREERARLKRKTNTRRSSSTQPATRSFVPTDVDGEREEEVAASTNNFKKSPATTPKQQLRSMPRMEEEEDDYTSYRSRMGDTSHFYVRRPKKPANFQPKRRFPQDVAFRNEAHYMSGVFVRRSTRETSPDVDNATDAPPERRKPEDDVILMVTSLEDE